MNIADTDFAQISDLIRHNAQTIPAHAALVESGRVITYAELDVWMNRVANALRRDGLKVGDAIAMCDLSSWAYAVVYLGALRAGMVVAPLAPGSTAEGLERMIKDANARLVFMPGRIELHALADWLGDASAEPVSVVLPPEHPFNIIYSSGTTGEPKGIVQSHAMRWGHVKRAATYGYSAHTVTLLSTPLYSNTTLVVFFPSLAAGSCVVLMPKFDASKFLQLAQEHRATHTMLVPVQYQRLMALPEFGSFDLSSFQFKFSTSAPFRAALKQDVVQRWPGALVEFYGMTEGGGTAILQANLHPDKLHTVGQAAPGHDIRLIDDEGHELPAGATGEVVGRSATMMNEYHGKPEKTREAEWYDKDGLRFIRTGDVGRFDADGFLTLLDRKKDLVISGGFNVYPSDLEAELRLHPAVADVAVVGMPSEQWGETPVAFVVLAHGQNTNPEDLRNWLNQRVGKMQRLSALHLIAELPRSAIGKVLKRELRVADPAAA